MTHEQDSLQPAKNQIKSLKNKISKQAQTLATDIAQQIYHDNSRNPQSFTDDLDILGTGAGRIVATHASFPDGTVLKFAQEATGDPYTDGLIQNALEYYISTTSTPLSAYTLPLLTTENSTDPLWLCFPQAATIEKEEAHELYTDWDALQQRGFESEDIYAPQNWGFWNHQPYLIDFGYAHPNNTHCEMTNIASNVDSWSSI